MPQMSPSQARVIDPVLTTVARGYKNAQSIGRYLFPRVPVKQRGGKILSFGKEDFMLYSTGRAPGTNTKRVQFGYQGNNYTLESHSLEGVLPIELLQEAQAVPGVDLGNATVRKVQNIISMRLEYAQAQLATNAANYAASNKTTLSGTSQWSDLTSGVSDPIKDVEAGKEAIRKQTGQRPNTLAVGASVGAMLKQHPKIIDRIKYTGRDVATTDLLASLFGVENFVIGDGIYTDANGASADIWGKAVVLAFTQPGELVDNGAPTFGYTYQLDGYVMVEEPYYDRNSKSWIYPVTDEVAPVIAGADAGYLISGAVA